MLVLSRKRGQSIVIAGEIVISVVDVAHGRVQIGVSAPRRWTVHREEVHRRIEAERRQIQLLPQVALEAATSV